MASNPYVNKVVYGSDTLIDLTADTVTAASLLQGYTAHDASGALVTGTASGGGGTTAGTVYQDGEGYLVLDDEAGGSSVTVDALTVTANGTYTAATGHAYSPVTVNVASGAAEKQVNFLDYDGTVLHSYTSAEFAALTALPSNPTHSGLTSQGWNWTLAEVNAQLAAQPDAPVWVGQTYVTTSGDTEIDVTFSDADYLSPYLGVCPNGTVTIDWGDGSSTETITGTSLTAIVFAGHTYASTGDYTITLSTTNGLGFCGSSSNYGSVLYTTTANDNRRRQTHYSGCVTAVRLGSGTAVSSYAFSRLLNCEYVTVPSSVTSIGTYAFQNCYSLQSLTIPDGVTSIGTYAFQSCYSLQSLTIPDGVTSIGNSAFQSCYSLQSLTIPDGVTSIGNSAFQSCYSLQSLTIPDGVTSIGTYAFYNCASLQSLTIPDGVTSIGTYAFQSCYSLQSLTIPDGVTSIGNSAFQSCYSLQSLTIPDGVTSIGNSAFQNCYSLQSLTIPDGVTSIGTSAFAGCYTMEEYHLEPTTPPTLAGTNAFSNIQSYCTVYVPYSADGSVLAAYQAATNWSTYASYMQEEAAS